MARSQRKYDHEYKVQAVKLEKEIGGAKAAKELGFDSAVLGLAMETTMKATLCQHTVENASVKESRGKP